MDFDIPGPNLSIYLNSWVSSVEIDSVKINNISTWNANNISTRWIVEMFISK